jgi:DNA-directed RNA polymerase subunit RPC12/RpoP
MTPDAPPDRYPCPGCGAVLAFSPRDGALACPYCGRSEPIAAPRSAVRERPLEEAAPAAGAAAVPGPAEVACAACGAGVALPAGETAGKCPFCGSSLFAPRASTEPWLVPEGVIPFATDREQAGSAIRSWIASRWFAPSALRRLVRTEGAQGVYLPFWTFDAATESEYTGERGRHYWETQSYTERDASGRVQTRTRRVQRTRWYPASGRVARRFDDVLVPATRSVDPGRLTALEPWDLAKVVPFDTAYLAGFKAQRHQVEVDAGFEDAKTTMAAVILGDVRADIGGDEQRVLDVRTAHSEVTYKQLLLPVWIAAYRFRGKVYQVAVNARTGEVSGERPYSVWKIAGLVALIAAAVAAIALLSGR